MIGKKINQLATELAPASTDLTIIGNPTTGVSKKITLAQLGAIFSGAVSFYTNYAAFPTPGTTDVIFCAKDTQKLYLWSGSAYVEVFPSQSLLDTYQLRSEKGVSNGYASLDSSGKVPISQLPSSIMEYKGTWSAATNTPTLANGTGDTGDVYLCNAAGTVNFGAGALTFAVGDYVVYSGTIWQRSSGAVGTVTSVAATITGNAIGITGSPVTTSGTLALAFAGTSAQYVNGAGNLITFPSIISQAQNLVTEVYNETGATLTKGTIVYINGGHGNLPTVTKALATGDSTSAQTYGIVQADITNNNNGYVVAAGRLENIDTQSYTAGTQLYLSSTTAGTWTSTKQYAPAHLVYVGIIVRSHPTQGIVEVKIQNGYEMDELHNVAAQSPTNNDGLFWEASTSLWKNKSIATILGYTPQAQLNGTGFVKASGTTITYDNSTYVTTDTFQTISASKTFSVGFSIASAGGTNQLTSFINTSSLFSGSGGTNVFGFNSANNIYFGKGLDNGGVFQWNNAAVRYYTLPDATGTIALVGGSGVGTVTSVGLSSATSGVTIGSSPITTSGTITLAIATASGSQQGLLSSTDWTTFNNKQNAFSGTANYIAKFTATGNTIGNSLIYDNGTNVGIGNTSPSYKLDVSGTGRFTSNLTTDGIFIGRTSNGQAFGVGNGVDSDMGIFVQTNNIAFSNSGTSSGISFALGGTTRFSIASTGAATFSSTITSSGGRVTIQGTNQNSVWFNQNAGGSSTGYLVGRSFGSTDTQDFFIYDIATSTRVLAIASTGAATLSATASYVGEFYRNNNSDSRINITNTTTTSGGDKGLMLGEIGTDSYFYNYANGNAIFGTNATERMRITSGGNVGIGTTSPQTVGSYKVLDIQGSSGAMMYLSSNSSDGGRIYGNSGGLTYDATAAGHFWYTPGGERMRILSTGEVLVNATATTASAKFYVNGIAAFGSAYVASLGTGLVYSSSGTLTSTNPSDQRLKNDIKSLSYGLNEILQLNPKTFYYNDDVNKERLKYGFIAQEVKGIMPELARKLNAETDYLGLETEGIYVTLVNAIKEQQKQIEELKAKIK